MKPARLAVRFPAVDVPADLEPAIGAMHRLIQYGSAEGLVLDVADYRHVPHGPGVLLVGHDVDYGINQQAFTVTRKRCFDDDTATQLRDAVRMGLGTIAALHHIGELAATFDTSRFVAEVYDRKLGDRASLAQDLQAAARQVADAVFGESAKVALVESDDPRTAPTVQVEADSAAAASPLEVLGGSRAKGQSPWDIPVEELARLRASDEDFVLLDVREESEYETVNLGGTLIPLATLAERFDDLDRGAKVVVHCRAGRRGASAVQQLREAGFEDAWNVNGALMAWIDRIDPTLPRY